MEQHKELYGIEQESKQGRKWLTSKTLASLLHDFVLSFNHFVEGGTIAQKGDGISLADWLTVTVAAQLAFGKI